MLADKLAKVCATCDYQVLATFADGWGNDDAGGLSGADSRTGADTEAVLAVDSQIRKPMT